MKKSLATLAAAAAVAMIAGCATNTHEPADLVKFKAKAEVETVWSKRLGESLGSFLTPAVTENAVYAAGDKFVYRLDPRTGSETWEVKMDAKVTHGVGTDGFTVAFGLETGEIVALDAEGKTLWRSPVPGGLEAAPLVGRSTVVARAGDGHVIGFDSVTGRQLWTYQRQNPALTLHAPLGGAFIKEWTVVGQANGRLLALNDKGRQIWQAMIAQAKGTSETERMIDVLGSPVHDATMICATAYQGRITCMNNEDGRPLWSTEVNAIDGPSMAEGRIAVTDNRGAVRLWRASTGAKLWTNDKLLWRAASGPLVTSRAVVVGDYDGYVHFMDINSGEFIARESLSGPVAVAPVAVPDQKAVLVQTQKGRLALLRLE